MFAGRAQIYSDQKLLLKFALTHYEFDCGEFTSFNFLHAWVNFVFLLFWQCPRKSYFCMTVELVAKFRLIFCIKWPCLLLYNFWLWSCSHVCCKLIKNLLKKYSRIRTFVVITLNWVHVALKPGNSNNM